MCIYNTKKKEKTTSDEENFSISFIKMKFDRDSKFIEKKISTLKRYRYIGMYTCVCVVCT